MAAKPKGVNSFVHSLKVQVTKLSEETPMTVAKCSILSSRDTSRESSFT